MDWNTFCSNLKEVLELERYTNSRYIKWQFDDTNLSINYYLENGKQLQFSYTKRKFIKDYQNASEQKELYILNENYYEIPISFKNESFSIIPRYDRIIGKEYKDNENNLKYVINTPSNQFWLKLIELKIKPKGTMLFRRISFFEKDFKDDIDKKDIFDLLKIIYRDCITLGIYSIDTYRKADFQGLADAFIFNINYNTDLGIRQAYNIENLYERRRNNRFRNESIEKVSTPKRIYKKELIEQYNMASISDEPFIKYLCYYHILEHFYEAVYKEDLIQTVKEELTLPSFSLKKENSIIKLIDVIKDKVKYDRESFDGDELEALELVIKKYVDVKIIKKEIENINPTLVDYYDKEKVNFSKGVSVNFNDMDNLCKNIAKRIYFTRNALVHYKSNDFSKKEKGIYRPFNDREELLKEIPLIRILAETVIINDAQII